MDSSQVVKGVLELAVLAVLSRSDDYGYAVVRELRDAGLDGVAEASVYGTLRRLYGLGLVSCHFGPSSEGPPRKYFCLTAEGRRRLRVEREQWRAFATTMEVLTSHDSGG